MKLYKLTTQDNKTRAGYPNETLWGEGISHTATGSGGLCTNGVIHAYRNPLLAVLLNEAHACIINPKLWEAVGNVTEERSDKCGVKTLTTIREISLPVITTEQRIRFAIACALEIYKARTFVKWAHDWLYGKDRTARAAEAAAAASHKLSTKRMISLALWAVSDKPYNKLKGYTK